MPLETATFLNDLDSSFPLDGDDPTIGYKHIQLIKEVLKAQFPGIGTNGFAKQIDLTADEWNSLSGLTSPLQSQLDGLNSSTIPIGSIIMYSGLVDDIPSNFEICDGIGGTPDLFNLFLRGADNDGDINTTGGSKDAVNISHLHRFSHTHPNSTSNSAGSHTHPVGNGDVVSGSNKSIQPTDASRRADAVTNSTGAHTHTASSSSPSTTVSTVGESGTDKNTPEHVQLIYIRRAS